MALSGDEFEDAQSEYISNTNNQTPVAAQDTKASTKSKRKNKNKGKNKGKSKINDVSLDPSADEKDTSSKSDPSQEALTLDDVSVQATGDWEDDNGLNPQNVSEAHENIAGITSEVVNVNLNSIGDTKDEESNIDSVEAPDSEEVRKLVDQEEVSLAQNITNGSSPKVPERTPIKDWFLLNGFEAAFINKSNQSKVDKFNHIYSTFDKTSSNYLLQSNYNQLNEEFESKDSKVRASINSGTESIRKTYNDIKNTVGSLDTFEYKIDWDFWTKIVNDYQGVLKSEPDQLNDLIMKGIPKEIRGIIWQLISKSKNYQLEEFYYQLKNDPSVHEKSIKRDLTRTSFFTNVDQVRKGDELFNVIKAYSLFDPDVGYTQGMIFIAIPLIMNMNDSECFCLLVNLMKDYQLRELFCPEMKGLHLLLYKFDRLLESLSPVLFNHLLKQGIKSSMYASQWFLTFFAYKFPLDIVIRIYDIIITQGVESILKFGINLMLKNESNLLLLNFDRLLDFLKNKLFNVYVNEKYIDFHDEKLLLLKRAGSVSRRFSILSSSKRTSNSHPTQNGEHSYYRLDDLVYDSMQINIDPVALSKFENEFQNIYDNEKAKLSEIEEIKVDNGNLRHKIKILETSYSNLNREHIGIVQQMVDIKFALPELEGEIADLNGEIDHLKQETEGLESKVAGDSSLASLKSGSTSSMKSPALPSKIENDIQELLKVNANETERFAELQDELDTLISENAKLDTELALKGNGKWFGRWK
ncbi:uncharacterized protein PRCAT00004703001 [Priceomyces carsonii]|uniref:uncharacterized protein n=1 Tax=Priceomyces carsonii TaxID=28549 RepID=UPI002EDB3E24|nr:unnamed protein product [Priceomyces carsonii]